MSENHSGNSVGLLMLGLTLALGIIISSLVVTGTLKEIKTSDQTITVKGYAEKSIISDLAIWSGTVTVRSTDLVDAYSKLERDMGKFNQYLKSKGIKPDKIQNTAVQTSKVFKMTDDGKYTNYIIGYELYQDVNISSDDVFLIQQISNEATSLIKDGIEINSNMPQYFYTKLNDLKIKMLGEAAKDAKARADQLGENTGSKVGSLKYASQGVFQITSENSTTVSDWGEYDVSSIKKTIKAVVTVNFSIR